MRTPLLPFSALVLAIAATSCSTGPAPPKPGTPAFFWGAARDSYRSGDYQQTGAHLLEVLSTDNEFAARARPWQIVVAAGVARGFAEMADSYEAGGRLNRSNSMPFHKQVTALRSLASTAAMEYTQGAHAFMEKDKEPTVLLAFAFPAGSAAQPGAIRKVATGMLIQDSERDSMQMDMLQRGVLMSVCRAVGSPDDTARAQEMFKAGEVRVPREAFLLAIARELDAQSVLFSPNKMDQPGRFKVMAQEALEALQGVPETKQTKALAAKIQTALKKIKGAT